MKKATFLSAGLAVLSLLLLFSQGLSYAQEPAAVKQDKEAIIVLSTVTVSEMQNARKILERNGVQLKEVYSPSVFIAKVPVRLLGAIKELDFIEAVSVAKLDLANFKDYEPSALYAIKLWNLRIEGQAKLESEKKSLRKTIFQEPLYNDLRFNKDLPKTKEERLKKDKEYQERWNKKRGQFEKQEKDNQQNWQKKHPKERKTKSFSNSLILSAPETGVSPASVSSVSKPKITNAGFYDTSLYMAGDIAVGIIFVKGSLGDWPETEKIRVYNDIVTALRQFSDDEPNAHIVFHLVKEDTIPQIGEPPHALDLTAHKEDVVGCYEYVNNLRNTANCHWAFLIIAEYGDGLAYAGYWGPRLRLYSVDLRNGYTVRHETMHTFGAMDQYQNASASPIDRVGYLSVVNANSQYNDGKGYFAGAGESQPDIMISGGPVGVYSRGQIGWRDSDSNGILDPLDTFSKTTNLTKSDTNPFTYTGKAVDKPLLNTFSHGDITLNTITKIEYRLNGGAWCEAQAVDGNFDSVEEDFTFTLPRLKNGTYVVETRATNSVGNTEVSYAKDTFTVTGSVITNVQPFAAFSITPAKTSIGHDVTVDASASSDIEDKPEQLQVRWNFKRDDGSDSWTAFSQNKVTTSPAYTTPGDKTIQLEVKDSQGLSQVITKKLGVAAQDLPPKACFTATPKNQHGVSQVTVHFDASGSADPEDGNNLKVRWDFDNDGKWDTGYSNNLTVDHTYSLLSEYSRVGVFQHSCAESVYVVGNYAYVADGFSRFQIIDISNPRLPVLTGSYNMPGLTAYGVYVSGNYAYVADYSAGLQIIDISNPRVPILAGSYDTPDLAYGVYVSGNYAYVADGTSGLQIIDISNPRVPILAGSYDTPGCAHGIFVSGNYAYVADSGSGLQIIDISNPRVPILAGSYDTPDQAASVYVLGNYAYIADYLSGLQVIDISNIRTPVLLGSCSVRGGYAMGVYVSGNYAYVASSFAGLQVIDFTSIGVEKKSFHWKVKAEINDGPGNTSSTTRDIWAVTYNHPPSIEGIRYNRNANTVQAVNATDPDINTTWDGLLEYRWDFENDGTWDTRFATDNFITMPASLNAAKIACQVRDRFGATASVIAPYPDTTAPTTAISGLNSGWLHYYYDNPTMTLTATDNSGGSGVKSITYTIVPDPRIANPSPAATPIPGTGSYSVTTTSPASYRFINPGIYTVTYSALDNAGNQEAIKAGQVKVYSNLVTLFNPRVNYNAATQKLNFTIRAASPYKANGVAYKLLSVKLGLRAVKPGLVLGTGETAILNYLWVYYTQASGLNVYSFEVPRSALGSYSYAVINFSAQYEAGINKGCAESYYVTFNPNLTAGRRYKRGEEMAVTIRSEAPDR